MAQPVDRNLRPGHDGELVEAEHGGEPERENGLQPV